MKIIIRAGGVGTRLWPISRQDNPKQFQALVNNQSLIRNTVDRVKPLLKNENDLFISVNEHLVKRLKKEIPELPDKNIISEPANRNTGPAICLESCVLAKRFSEEIVVASLPSDDYISNEVAFHEMLRQSEKFLEKKPDYIVTPGAEPTYPDTGYSYIKAGKSLDGPGKIFEAANWVEKPAFDECKRLIKSGEYFCHTGIYIWKLKTILDFFKKFQSTTYEVCKKLAAGGKTDYASLEKMTIEAAVTLKAPQVAVIAGNEIGWSDLGKWHIVARIIPSGQDGNLIKGNVLAISTKNCLIYGLKDKLLATIGLDDVVIIQTDRATLVCPKDKSDEVKKIVEELEKKGLTEYL